MGMPLNLSRSVVLDSTGAGRIDIVAAGGDWMISRVAVSTTSTVRQPTADLYRNGTAQADRIDGTYTGSKDTAYNLGLFQTSETLIVLWAGGDAGATATLSISATQYDAGKAPPDVPAYNPFSNSILAGTTLVRDAIRSPNYVAGTSGWSVNKNGSAEFNDITVRGTIDAIATSGQEVKIDPTSASIQFWPAPGPGTYRNGTIEALTSGTQAELILTSPQPLAGGPFVDTAIRIAAGDLVNMATIYLTALQGQIQLQAADVLLNNISLPRGIMAAPTATSNNGTATSAVTGAEIKDAQMPDYTFTAVVGHRYRVMHQTKLNTSVAGDVAEVRIRDGGNASPTTASPLVASSAQPIAVAGGTGQQTKIVSDTFVATATTVTLGVFTVRSSGTGAEQPVGARYLYVEDIGAL